MKKRVTARAVANSWVFLGLANCWVEALLDGRVKILLQITQTGIAEFFDVTL